MSARRTASALGLTAAMLGATLLGTATAASAAPPKCPPGQTAVVTVVDTELVTTCRIL